MRRAGCTRRDDAVISGHRDELRPLADQRRALPVAIDNNYVFEGPDGKMALIDLFEGRSQLIIYDFMWLHDIDEGRLSRSFAADG
jgi:predicted dithiol-disulfide oxidoreductase (DUF899 family)